jgi:hypothetical protein
MGLRFLRKHQKPVDGNASEMAGGWFRVAANINYWQNRLTRITMEAMDGKIKVAQIK